MSETKPALDFTGERFTPECVREIWYEHWHRYVFARQLAKGKRVLDAACGEGYGSALLADVAASVVGADISDQAIAHARSRYGDRAESALRTRRRHATRRRTRLVRSRSFPSKRSNTSPRRNRSSPASRAR